MKCRIDVEWFDCPDCGHRCTAPEEINAFSHKVEKYEEIDAIHIPDKQTEDIMVQTLEQYHYGNDFKIIPIRVVSPKEGEPLNLNPDLAPELYKKVIQIERSYAEVKYQSATLLEESNHIVLSCPQCHTTLYEVHW